MSRHCVDIAFGKYMTMNDVYSVPIPVCGTVDSNMQTAFAVPAKGLWPSYRGPRNSASQGLLTPCSNTNVMPLPSPASSL